MITNHSKKKLKTMKGMFCEPLLSQEKLDTLPTNFKKEIKEIGFQTLKCLTMAENIAEFINYDISYITQLPPNDNTPPLLSKAIQTQCSLLFFACFLFFLVFLQK